MVFAAYSLEGADFPQRSRRPIGRLLVRAQEDISILSRNYRSMKREQILIEALPYIREFYGSFVVIKIGGHAMIDKSLMEGIIEDIVLLR